VIVFIVFFIPSLALAAHAANAGDDAVERWVRQHADRAQAVEVAGVRYRVTGDLDGAGREDIAVLYTLKHSRHGESRYLAVFTTHRDGLKYHGHALVAGPRAGEAVRATILKRHVVVEMLTFAPGDAPCCPTRASARRYLLAPKGLALARH
jgi:hypothetical protein